LAAALVWVLGEGFRHTRQPIEQMVRPFGVTAAQYGILHRLADEPGLSRVEVARRNFISPQAASVALATLESKGLVTSTPRTQNNRVVGANLTEKGERVLAQCVAVTTPLVERFVAPLSVDEQTQLVDMLRRCVEQSAD
jgi:DNA-binding MarR family transcriptional regulator